MAVCYSSGGWRGTYGPDLDHHHPAPPDLGDASAVGALGSPLKTEVWQRLRARVLAASNICGICKQPIDLNLSGRDPMGPTVNHRIPRSEGGDVFDIRNLEPAHLKCN